VKAKKVIIRCLVVVGLMWLLLVGCKLFGDPKVVLSEEISEEEFSGLMRVANEEFGFVPGSLYRRDELTKVFLNPYSGGKVLVINIDNGRGLFAVYVSSGRFFYRDRFFEFTKNEAGDFVVGAVGVDM